MDLCRACHDDLSRNFHCCYRCGESFATANPLPQLCGRCLRRMPNFDETRAPFHYDKAMQYLITQLKFHDRYSHARLLGNLMADHLADDGERPDCIIPMPLHPKRYQERGFNQALEIARHVARQLDITLDYRSCIRTRDTRHQIELAANRRRKNMRQAFDTISPLTYNHVAILDDVMTTGATADALAGALKRRGVARVDVWVCARA